MGEKSLEEVRDATIKAACDAYDKKREEAFEDAHRTEARAKEACDKAVDAAWYDYYQDGGTAKRGTVEDTGEADALRAENARLKAELAEKTSNG